MHQTKQSPRPYLPASVLALLAWAICCLWAPVQANAADTHAAVAANFTTPAREIAALFETRFPHRIAISTGSTGQLYTQILHGAPFDLFLAADQVRPEQAEGEGLAAPASRFTYAVGRLALYSPQKDLSLNVETLGKSAFRKIAIANPRTAPYGAAAIAALNNLGLYDAVAAKIVQGTNIAQTYQFVFTGNADVGFVALSQIRVHPGGSHFILPQSLHPPIAQDAVLLTRGQDNVAAIAFLEFLKGAEAAAVLRAYGYEPGTGAAMR